MTFILLGCNSPKPNYVINNKDKVIESVDRYQFLGSPLEYKKIIKHVKDALSKITKP
jgi:hypothetical protein